jgi:outer membrane receptor for ferric coprogen and ferric-rhodotorulic acid
MQLLSKHRGFGQSSRLALAVALAVPGAIALPAVAHAQEAAQDFNIAGGDLGAALQRYSAATGVQLVYSSDLVAGKRSPGVSGRMSPQQALGQLLAGSGLSARVSGNTATLVQASASGDVAAAEGERLLGPVRVEGSQRDSYQAPVRGDGIAQLGGVRGGQDEEVVGYRARVATAGVGAPMAIEDIPRAVSVQTQEQLEKQDIANIGDALLRAPGVTVVESGSQGGATRVFARGYQVNQYQVDGGVPRDLNLIGDGLLNLDAYERVELTRGPNPLFTGEGSPGGSINLVRKRPGMVEQQSVVLEGGSFDRLSAKADISTPSLFGSSIAFRGIASMRREGAHYDNYVADSGLLYGIFDVSLGEAARLEVGIQYNYSLQDGLYFGVPRTVEGSLIDVPRRFNYVRPDSYQKVESTEVFARLNADIHDDWDLEAGFVIQDQLTEFTNTSVQLFLRDNGGALATGFLNVNRGDGPLTTSQIGLDAKLTGRFETFGLQHNFYAGVTYSRSDPGTQVGACTTDQALISSGADLLNPRYISFPCEPFSASAYSGWARTKTGMVISDTVSWNDLVDATASLRYDQSSNISVNFTRNTATGNITSVQYSPLDPTLAYQGKGVWNPSFALAVHPIEKITVYGSYSQGFNRQDTFFSRFGEDPDYVYVSLAPRTYESKEVGIKIASDKWLGTLSAYFLDGKNLAAGILGVNECPPLVDGDGYSSPCFTGYGQDRSRGIEAELSGELLPGLSVLANFTFSKARTVPLPEDFTGSPEGPVLPLTSQAPQSSGSLFLDYAPAFAPGLSVQLGARYRGRVFQSGTRQFYDGENEPICSNLECTPEPFEFSEESFLVFDLGVDYKFSDNLSAKLFVENLTNTRYLSTVSDSTQGGNFYGRPRSFMASVRWSAATKRPANGRNPSTGRSPFGRPESWYIALDAGAHLPQDLHAEASGVSLDGITPVAWDFELNPQAALAGRLGYRFAPSFRGELEVGYRPSVIGDIGGGTAAPFGVCGAVGSSEGIPFDCDNATGNVDDWSLMTNIIYDIPLSSKTFAPFIGLGAGVSRHSVGFGGKMEGVGGDGPWQLRFDIPDCCSFVFPDSQRTAAEFIGGQSTKVSFAWQATAGISARLSDRLSIDLAYRYYSVPSMKWTSRNVDPAGGGLTPVVGNFKARYSTSIVTVGVRWALGAGG